MADYELLESATATNRLLHVTKCFESYGNTLIECLFDPDSAGPNLLHVYYRQNRSAAPVLSFSPPSWTATAAARTGFLLNGTGTTQGIDGVAMAMDNDFNIYFFGPPADSSSSACVGIAYVGFPGHIPTDYTQQTIWRSTSVGYATARCKGAVFCTLPNGTEGFIVAFDSKVPFFVPKANLMTATAVAGGETLTGIVAAAGGECTDWTMGVKGGTRVFWTDLSAASNVRVNYADTNNAPGSIVRVAVGATIAASGNSWQRTIRLNSTQYVSLFTSGSNIGAVFVDTTAGTHTAVVTHGGAIPNWRSVGNTGDWDAYYDAAQGKIWVVEISATAGVILKLGLTINFATPSLTWDTAATLVTTTMGSGAANAVLRCIPEPDQEFIDFEVFSDTVVEAPNRYSVRGTNFRFNTAPTAPELLAPANNALVDLSAGYTFSWNYPDIADSQTAYAFRRTDTDSGVVQYWNAATQLWQNTVVYNTSAVESVTFPVLTWSPNREYVWEVSVKDTVGMPSAYSAFTLFNTSAPSITPTVTPATPNTTTDYPVVSWTYFQADGYLQKTYRLRLFTVAQYSIGGFDPATSPATYDTGVVVGTAASVTMPQLAPTTTYRAYIQVTTDSSLASAWTNVQWSQNVTEPAAPTIVATADNANARITLAVTGGVAGSNCVIEYSDNAGATWSTLRNSPFAYGAGTTVNTSDYESIPNTSRTYRAKTVSTTASPVKNSSYSATSSATVTMSVWWLKDPIDSSRNMILDMGTVNKNPTWDWDEEEEQAVYHPLGNPLPVVVSDVVRGDDASLKFVTTSEAEFTAFRTLRSSQRVLLLQSGWQSKQWYIRIGNNISVKEQNTTPIFREVNAPYVEVAKP